MINLFVKFAYLALFERLRKPAGSKPNYIEWIHKILDKDNQIPHHSEFIEFADKHLQRATFSEAIVGLREEETYDFFKWLLFGIDQRTLIENQRKWPHSSSQKKNLDSTFKKSLIDDGENYSLDDLLETIHPEGGKILLVASYLSLLCHLTLSHLLFLLAVVMSSIHPKPGENFLLIFIFLKSSKVFSLFS